MSAESDKYEKLIAESINSVPGIEAKRPIASTGYPDVQITKYHKKPVSVWVEVKMNHTDNLSNPRVYYSNGLWQTTYKTPAAQAAVDILNKSEQTKTFLKNIAKFSGIPIKKIKIPTTKTGLNDPSAVPLDVMKQYFDQPGVNRYIVSEEGHDLGKVVTDHYTKGKSNPALYMQASDDFYMISSKNPLGLPKGIPVLKGTGAFKVRVATRSEYYEVQAEIKITNMPSSNFSVRPGSSKKNPFSP